MKQKNIFSTWAIHQSLGFAIGWTFHGIFSHLFTGEHDFYLNVPQLIMHNISLTGMILILLYAQSRACTQLFGFSLIKYWPWYTLLHLGVFWAGYYLIGPPVDLVFSFLAIALLNGILMSKLYPLKKWTGFSLLSSLIGLVLGTLLVIPVEEALLPSLSGLPKHIVVFLIEGSAVGILIAISGAFFLRKIAIRGSAETGWTS